MISPKVCQLCGLSFAKPCINYVMAAKCQVWRRHECKSSRELLTSHIITTMTSVGNLTGARSAEPESGASFIRRRKAMTTKTTRIRTLEGRLKRLGCSLELTTTFDRVLSDPKSTTSSNGQS